MLEIAKCVDKRIWWHMHPLRQFKYLSYEVRTPAPPPPARAGTAHTRTPHRPLAYWVPVPPDAQVLSKLEANNATLERLDEMTAREIGEMVRHPRAGDKVKDLVASVRARDVDTFMHARVHTHPHELASGYAA